MRRRKHRTSSARYFYSLGQSCRDSYPLRPSWDTMLAMCIVLGLKPDTQARFQFIQGYTQARFQFIQGYVYLS